MSKILSEKEAKLQKKLIPLNIFVCIISLVAAISLFFTPIVKINFGKIVNDPAVMEYIEEIIDEQLGSDLEGSGQEGIDFKPAVTSIVKNVLSTTEGDLNINAFGAAKVAFAGGENKAETVLDELFFGDEALVTKLIDSVVEGVAALFTQPEGHAIIESVIVTTIATSLVSDLNSENVTPENIQSVTEKFKGIENVTDGNVAPVMDEVVAEIEKVFGEEVNISEDEKQQITQQVQKIYDEAQAELPVGEKVTMEALICVTLSKNVDLSELNINKIFEDLFGDDSQNGENPEGSAARVQAVDDETPVEPPLGTPGDRVIVTDYNGLLDEMGFDETTLKGKIREGLVNMFNEYLDDIKVGEDLSLRECADYYPYIFYGWLAFIVPWLILFLFSFFHMIAKNKRFTMWYVKLYSFLPCLVFFLAPMLAPKLIPVVAPDLISIEATGLVFGVLSGVTSFTFISGICYVLLWLVSIFWAFPIKRKIRKERKACKAAKKNGTYSYYSGPEAEPKGKKGKKGKPDKNGKPVQQAEAAPRDLHTYGDYGSKDDFYGTNSYDAPYGGALDDSYDDTYNTYGGYDSYDSGGWDDPYEDDYYGSDLDDDYDDYSYGSDYGSYYDDDDDF